MRKIRSDNRGRLNLALRRRPSSGEVVSRGHVPRSGVGCAIARQTAKSAGVRATHRLPKRRYKKRMHMCPKLDRCLRWRDWLATELPITALAIVRRVAPIGRSSHV
jgi:hypothetical protein